MPAATEALNLLSTITAGVSFDIPVIDLSLDIYKLPGDETAEFYQPVTRVPFSQITDGDIEGPGIFDLMMKAGKAHLIEEFENNRITGAQYTEAYIALIQTAMDRATSFILARESTFWQAQTGQIEAITKRAVLEQERLRTAQAAIDANNAKAAYSKTVLSLANEALAYDQGQYQLSTILPKNALILDAQKAKLDEEILIVPKQGVLLDEQLETARAQTLDTRTDGVTLVSGVVGRQKSLFEQQITSYQRSDETKAAKILGDTWITQKTIDEGLLAPTAFTNAKLDEAFSKLLANLSLDGP